MTRSLVTGAAGFIGRRLVADLLAQGDEVVVVDRFSRSDPSKIDWQNPSSLVPPASGESGSSSEVFDRVKVIKTDIRDPAKVGPAMLNVDRVFHSAAALCTQSLELSRSINVGGTRVLAEAAAAQDDPPVFVFVSSLAAAGPGNSPATESGDCHPVSHYGRTKLEAENLLQELSPRLPITIARPPCVIGPGDRNLLALYKTVKQGWNVVLSKTSRYSYVSVTDLVPGLIVASERGRRLIGTDPKRQGTYYLTDPKPVTFVELAEMIASTIDLRRVRHLQVPRSVGWTVGGYGEFMLRVFGKRIFLNFDKIREGIAGSWVCDGTRAAEDLSFAPGADLATRIKQTTESYRLANWI